MKILLILLGCLAVANATCYSYRFSSSCFYPPRTCYRFTSYSCRAWFTCSYYSGVLKVYPEETCEEKDVDTLKSECETKLSDKRTEILGELNQKFEDWKSTLASTISDFKSSHRTYQENRFQPCIDKAIEEGDADKEARLIEERDRLIREYDEKLDEYQTEAEGNYQTSIDNTMERIKEYHDKMIENFEACLNKRLEKITEYNGSIDERVNEYEQNYRDALNDELDRQRDVLRQALKRIHDNSDETSHIEYICTCYVFDPSIDTKVSEYRTKLEENAEKLKEFYKCNYKCYAYSGCLNFFKRNYYSYCSTLGQWWCYRLCQSTPSARYVKCTYKWQKCEYKDLKSCDPLEENETRDKVLEDMRTKNSEAVGAAREECETFFSDWETKHAEYATKYREIIVERHDACIAYLTECLKAQREDGVLTSEDEAKIEEKSAELAGKVDGLVEDYEEKLKKQRDDARDSTKESITNWETKLEEFAVELADKHQECLDSFDTKVYDYKDKLDVMIAQRRTCLETNYNKVIDKNVESLENLIKSWLEAAYEGDTYIAEYVQLYRTKLEGERDTTLSEFDTHWATTKADLAAHYACCLRCASINYCVRSWVRPRCFSWRVCYPTTRCYRYFYKTYCVRYYRKTVGGHYYCY